MLTVSTIEIYWFAGLTFYFHMNLKHLVRLGAYLLSVLCNICDNLRL